MIDISHVFEYISFYSFFRGISCGQRNSSFSRRTCVHRKGRHRKGFACTDTSRSDHKERISMPKKDLIQKNHVQFYSKGADSQEPSRGPILQTEWLNLIAREPIPKSQAQAHRKNPDSANRMAQSHSKGPDSQEPGSIPRIRDPSHRSLAQSHGEQA